MCIVDDHGEILSRTHKLETTRHTRERTERRRDIRCAYLLRKRRPRRREYVVDVEQSRDTDMQFDRLCLSMHEGQLHAVLREVHIPHREVCFALHAVGDDGTARMGTHGRARRIIRIEHGGLARLCSRLRHEVKEPRLCPRVVLHCLVIVEVILRQIREHRRVELDARNAPLIERVGGYLHHDRIHTARTHLGEQLLHNDDIGRRVRRGEHLVLHHNLYRPDQPDALPRMTQDCAHEVARRCLAVRARDADDAHAARGIVVEIRDNGIQRLLQVRHVEHAQPLGHIHRLPLRQNGASSRPRRIWYEAVCVHMSAGDADKESPLADAPRIPLNARDLGVAP